MNPLDSIVSSINLILKGDRELFGIVFLSIKLSFIATTISTILSLPISLMITQYEFIGKKIIITIINTLMALPTVVVGLLVYSLLSRNGPLGCLSLLYTPYAMVIGQVILISPIITGLLISSISLLDIRVKKEAIALGANKFQVMAVIFEEGRQGFVSAIICGFGRVFAEVGISMMVGGNIASYTRNIPTAIALETSKGNFAHSFALGLILLFVAFIINPLFHYLRK
ncbi:MAG: ABC transporter permease [bacterium]